MKPRVYIDTSVFGGCEDEEFSQWSNELMDEIRRGSKIAVVSDLTRRELESAPESVRGILESIAEENVENVHLNEEAERLASQYINAGVLSQKHIVDAQHIAIASIERVEVLLSWNFKQIVNWARIRGFNSVNLRAGYPTLEIRSPREVLDEEEI